MNIATLCFIKLSNKFTLPTPGYERMYFQFLNSAPLYARVPFSFLFLLEDLLKR